MVLVMKNPLLKHLLLRFLFLGLIACDSCNDSIPKKEQLRKQLQGAAYDDPKLKDNAKRETSPPKSDPAVPSFFIGDEPNPEFPQLRQEEENIWDHDWSEIDTKVTSSFGKDSPPTDEDKPDGQDLPASPNPHATVQVLSPIFRIDSDEEETSPKEPEEEDMWDLDWPKIRLEEEISPEDLFTDNESLDGSALPDYSNPCMPTETPVQSSLHNDSLSPNLPEGSEFPEKEIGDGLLEDDNEQENIQPPNTSPEDKPRGAIRQGPKTFPVPLAWTYLTRGSTDKSAHLDQLRDYNQTKQR